MTQTTRMCPVFFVAAALVSGATFTGCGGGSSNGPELAYVEGKVTMDGEPLNGAKIEFVPKGGEGSPAIGTTDENGHFVMRFSLSKEGATVGENVVRIRTAGLEEDEQGNERQVPETVPAKYNANAEENPEMNVTVPAEGKEFNFELSSEGEIVEPDEGGGGGRPTPAQLGC